MKETEVAAKEVAILPGYGQNPYDDSYSLLRGIAEARYGANNMHLVEIDWNTTYPQWLEQSEAAIPDRPANSLDVLSYSMGALVALGMSAKRPFGKLALASTSCMGGLQSAEHAQAVGADYPLKQLKAFSRLDIPAMVHASMARWMLVFCGTEELPIMRARSAEIANARQAQLGSGRIVRQPRRLTAISIQGANHADALGAKYLNEVNAMLLAKG